MVDRADPDYSTSAREVTDIEILAERERPSLGRGPAAASATCGSPTRWSPSSSAGCLGRGARRGAARPARADPADHGGVVDAARRRARGVRPRPRPTCPAPRTRPSTPRSGCCRCSRPATAGTSAASRPRCTPTPGGSRSSSTTATRAVPASPSAGSTPRPRWLRATREAIASCGCAEAARRACSRPSAATRTTRSTRPARSPCSTCCSPAAAAGERARVALTAPLPRAPRGSPCSSPPSSSCIVAVAAGDRRAVRRWRRHRRSTSVPSTSRPTPRWCSSSAWRTAAAVRAQPRRCSAAAPSAPAPARADRKKVERAEHQARRLQARRARRPSDDVARDDQLTGALSGPAEASSTGPRPRPAPRASSDAAGQRGPCRPPPRRRPPSPAPEHRCSRARCAGRSRPRGCTASRPVLDGAAPRPGPARSAAAWAVRWRGHDPDDATAATVTDDQHPEQRRRPGDGRRAAGSSRADGAPGAHGVGSAAATASALHVDRGPRTPNRPARSPHRAASTRTTTVSAPGSR